MRKLSVIVAGGLLMIGLSGCSVVSAEEHQSCDAAGGTISEKVFPTGKDGWWEAKETKPWTLCVDSAGKIVMVFDTPTQRPADPDSDFLSHEGEFTRKCMDDGGEAWYQRKSKRTSYICVKEGAVISVGRP